MSEGLIDQVQGLLTTVSDDINRMHAETLANNETFLEALDDVAANVLGLQAVIAALVKTYPVDGAVAKAWIAENMDSEGQGAEKAEAVIDFLLGS